MQLGVASMGFNEDRILGLVGRLLSGRFMVV